MAARASAPTKHPRKGAFARSRLHGQTVTCSFWACGQAQTQEFHELYTVRIFTLSENFFIWIFSRVRAVSEPKWKRIEDKYTVEGSLPGDENKQDFLEAFLKNMQLPEIEGFIERQKK